MNAAPFRLAGIMGWPVGHSRSPVLHGHWLNRHGVAGAYVPLPVRPDQLGAALRALPLLGFAGCNLTIPHKVAALDHIDHIDPMARRIGSINTIIVRPDGALEGRSTDGAGFVAHLVAEHPAWTPGRRPVALLGAGGAARAIAAALAEAGETEIRLLNRTDRRAWDLVTEFGPPLRFWPWDDRAAALAETHLVINSTALGMVDQPPLALDPTQLPVDAIVADIVYVPLETPLLAVARARGNPVLDGLGMLLHQARPGFAAWFGIEPAVDAALRRAVLATLPA
jgi:shikimate dehydrogenase